MKTEFLPRGYYYFGYNVFERADHEDHARISLWHGLLRRNARRSPLTSERYLNGDPWILMKVCDGGNVFVVAPWYLRVVPMTGDRYLGNPGYLIL